MENLEIPRYQRKLEEELERTISWLSMNPPSDLGEYGKILSLVERLHAMMEKKEKKPSRPSKETMLNVGANLLGILMIIRHERVNVITSKALSFVPRLKM